jgi:hypothetical protein
MARVHTCVAEKIKHCENLAYQSLLSSPIPCLISSPVHASSRPESAAFSPHLTVPGPFGATRLSPDMHLLPYAIPSDALHRWMETAAVFGGLRPGHRCSPESCAAEAADGRRRCRKPWTSRIWRDRLKEASTSPRRSPQKNTRPRPGGNRRRPVVPTSTRGGGCRAAGLRPGKAHQKNAQAIGEFLLPPPLIS